jgi:glyoxylase-like metal-dependent hydrolase (beta-lactamase superfamily II)
MFRKTLFTSAVLTAAVAATMIVSAQAPPGGGKGDGKAKGGDAKGKGAPQGQMITQIKPGFYEVTGAGGNTSVRVTKEGLIVVDTKNLGEANYNDLMTQIKTVSTLPVKYVVITHVHQDHSGNTKSFEEAGAKVIANEGEKAELATYTAPAGKPAEPNVTYGKKTTIKLGGVKAEVYHFSRAHTGGDSVVYFPDLKIVAGGDAIVNGAPNIDFPNGGSAVEWPKLIASTLKLDFDTLIPGHGNVMTKADVVAYKGKWDMLVARAEEQVKKGTPKDKLLASIKTDDIGWNVTGAQWTPPARLDPFYAELSKAKK